MSDRKKSEALEDEDLERARGGGLLADPFGYEPITLERGAKAGYIGETEKNVWKAPAGFSKD